MIAYDYKCEDCEKLVEVRKPMDQWNRAEECPDCGKVMRRIFTPSHVKGNHTPKFHGR